ncbi:maleylpyruvate isomerase N-terminal domain-containing protein [Paractinoplanes brasiliensis]|uniref:Mycothiol maleylpyruvate isomerase-like protein n=1 Tax=Paractinoplanes brasiliensis TaxID=52695 RepID=A0A4R6K1R8_9ACTN|nr:maleylpyruvate isomerase N-terminal domain-containing protein [Actinoplanes brasiliensis]TDO42061.1 mycothiol maleylpyruvate isomerase-like protein [Actinoplanes brasiliensis]GID33064.1 hypothetical protein Abr02nite_80470 [Actinoplanes brasiliensis]
MSEVTPAFARHTLQEAGERFAGLVHAAADHRRRATAHWSVAETAAHTATLVRLLRGLLRPAERTLRSADEFFRSGTVDDVAELNRRLLREMPERDLVRLAGLIRDDLGPVLAAYDAHDPDDLVPWLGGSHVPVAGLAAHMVNEFLIHGRDIAGATGRPWSMPPAAWALFPQFFLPGIIRGGYGSMLDSDRPDRAGRIAVEFRSAYTSRTVLVLHDGRVSLGQPGGDVDVRVRFDPETLALVLFGRVGKARAVLTRGLSVTGRRPWLLAPFLGKVRMPPG